MSAHAPPSGPASPSVTRSRIRCPGSPGWAGIPDAAPRTPGDRESVHRHSGRVDCLPWRPCNIMATRTGPQAVRGVFPIAYGTVSRGWALCSRTPPEARGGAAMMVPAPEQAPVRSAVHPKDVGALLDESRETDPRRRHSPPERRFEVHGPREPCRGSGTSRLWISGSPSPGRAGRGRCCCCPGTGGWALCAGRNHRAARHRSRRSSFRERQLAAPEEAALEPPLDRAGAWPVPVSRMEAAACRRARSCAS
jgi:hypothetical protein